jgi:hypothetical protein
VAKNLCTRPSVAPLLLVLLLLVQPIAPDLLSPSGLVLRLVQSLALVLLSLLLTWVAVTDFCFRL